MASDHKLPDPPILVITDRHQARRPIADIAAAVFDAGGRWISVREKDLPSEEQREIVKLIAEQAPNDAVVGLHGSDLPKAARIRAAHLPRNGNPATIRSASKPDLLFGVSCHDLEAVRAAAQRGADYVSLSPIFASSSKPGYGPPLGLSAIREAAALLTPTQCRLIALGGVSAGNISACRRAGADGVAIMGDVMRAEDPKAVMQHLINAWNTPDAA